MIQVRTPDGSVAKFPEGTPPDVIERAMREKFGGPEAPRYDASGTQAAPAGAVAARPPDTLVDQIMGGANRAAAIGAQSLRGVRRGIANFAGLPVDIVNAAPMLANILPGVDGVGPIAQNPVGGSKSIDALLGGFGAVPEPADAGVAGRIAGRVGEEIGAGAPLALGALRAAGARTMEQVRELPFIARMMVEPAKVDPSRFMRQESLAAGVVGAGAGGAGEIARVGGLEEGSGGKNLAELFGGLGSIGLVSAARPVANSVGNTVRALVSPDNYEDAFTRMNVADTLGAAAGVPDAPGGRNVQPLIDQIERGNRPGAVVPGFVESLADRTQSPGIAAMEYARQSGPNSGQFVERRGQNVNAVDAAIRQNEPTEQTAGALRAELDLERGRRLTDAEIMARNAQDEVDNVLRGLQPTQGTTPAARGATIRSQLETARETARGETRAAYGGVDMNQPADFAPLAQSLDEVTAGLTETRRGLVPQATIDRVRRLGIVDETPQPTGILDASGNPITRQPTADPVALAEADDLRSELLRLHRAAIADPRAERGGRNAAEAIGRYADAVDEFLIGNLPPDQADALRAARDARRAEADAFGRAGDPVAAAVARYEGGQPRMRDEQLPGLFVNRPQNLETLFTRADTPETRTAIRDELLDRFGRSNARPEDAQRFIAEYGQQLNAFPGLQADLTRAATAREGALRAQGESEQMARQLGTPDRPGQSAVGRYLKFDDSRAEDAMKTVLNSPEPVRALDELLTFVNNDPKAVEAARRSFWNIMEGQTRSAGETTKSLTGTQPWLPNALKTFLDDPRNAAVAERLYQGNPEHLQNLRGIADALQGVDVRSRVRAPGTSGTAQGVNPLLTPETLQSRLYSYQRGQIGGSFLVTSIAAVSGRRAVGNAREGAVNRLLDKALLDPEFAALLLKENNPANRRALRRMGKGWMGNAVSTAIDALDGNEDPTVDAAMEDAR
jgi:hypothetical protein